MKGYAPAARRAAFTLLEMLVTVALSAVLAAAAAVSFAGAHRAARARDVAEQVARYDRLSREGARRFGRPGRLTFDLDRGTVSRGAAGGENPGAGDDRDGAAPPAALHLPDGFSIARVVSGEASTTAGRVSLPCSTRGQTPSYAVAVAGPGGETQWLIVAGLTGKVTPARDANEVDDIFRSPTGRAPGDGAPGDGPGPGGAGDDAR